MKLCPACQSQYADHLSFCQKDGTRLIEFDPNAVTTPYQPNSFQTTVNAPPPPTFTVPMTEPVARAVPLNQTPTPPSPLATQPIGAVTQPNFSPAPPTSPATNPTPPMPSPLAHLHQQPAPTLPASPALIADYSTNRSTATARPAKQNNWLPWLIVGIIALVLAVGVGIFWFVSGKTQRTYEAALEAGQYVMPAGSSAYDFYQQLKRDGASPDKLNALVKPHLSKMLAQPQQMLTDLALPGKREVAPEEAQNAWDQAQRTLVWASELDPKNAKLAAQAAYAAGRAAFLRGNKDQALELWKKAAEQDKTWFLPLNSLSVVYNERKNYPAARKACEEAIRRDPNAALPYNNLGTAWLLAKDDEKAEESYRKAIELAPNWPRPHAWLAEIAMRHKDYALAVEEYEMVLSLDVTTETSLDMAKVRKALEEARKLLEQGETTEPPVVP
jgi:tetratricopeptide (TPR) repeat protein